MSECFPALLILPLVIVFTLFYSFTAENIFSVLLQFAMYKCLIAAEFIFTGGHTNVFLYFLH